MSFLKNREQVIAEHTGSVNEQVIKKGDIWSVKTMIDIPRSLINAFVSKAKKDHGVDARENWSDTDLAELFVKYITTNFVNIDSLPVKGILGDIEETEGEAKTDVQPEEVVTDAAPIVEEPIQTEVTGEVTEPIVSEEAPVETTTEEI